MARRMMLGCCVLLLMLVAPTRAVQSLVNLKTPITSWEKDKQIDVEVEVILKPDKPPLDLEGSNTILIFKIVSSDEGLDVTLPTDNVDVDYDVKSKAYAGSFNLKVTVSKDSTVFTKDMFIVLSVSCADTKVCKSINKEVLVVKNTQSELQFSTVNF